MVIGTGVAAGDHGMMDAAGASSAGAVGTSSAGVSKGEEEFDCVWAGSAAVRGDEDGDGEGKAGEKLDAACAAAAGDDTDDELNGIMMVAGCAAARGVWNCGRILLRKSSGVRRKSRVIVRERTVVNDRPRARLDGRVGLKRIIV